MISQANFFLAVRTLKLVLQPSVDTACMKNMSALQSLDLGSGSKDFEADRAANFFLLSFYLFTLSFCKAILSTSLPFGFVVTLGGDHAHRAFILLLSFFKLEGRYRVYDVPNLYFRGQRLPV